MSSEMPSSDTFPETALKASSAPSSPLSLLPEQDLVAERLMIERQLDQLRGQTPQLPESLDLNPDVLRLLSKIHQDPFDPELSVRSLKRWCKIRDNNISSRFRYTLGITIRSYIERLRLDAASLLLIRSTIGVFDVALSVGYQNPQTFYGAFRRRFDCTPSVYRQRIALQIATSSGAV